MLPRPIFYALLLISEFQNAFKLFDKDDDGKITQDELIQIMKSFSQYTNKKELKRLLLNFNVTGRQKIPSDTDTSVPFSRIENTCNVVQSA